MREITNPKDIMSDAIHYFHPQYQHFNSPLAKLIVVYCFYLTYLGKNKQYHQLKIIDEKLIAQLSINQLSNVSNRQFIRWHIWWPKWRQYWTIVAMKRENFRLLVFVYNLFCLLSNNLSVSSSSSSLYRSSWVDQREKFFASFNILPERSHHATCDSVSVDLLHSAHHHAHMSKHV